jgi:hypothetical protein
MERQICSSSGVILPMVIILFRGALHNPKTSKQFAPATLMKFLSNMIRRSDDDLSGEAKRAPVIDDVWSGGIA